MTESPKDRQQSHAARFDSALYAVSPNIARVLSFLDVLWKEKVQEIRLRAGKPVTLTVGGDIYYVCKNASVSREWPRNELMVTGDDVAECYRRLTNQSVYSHLTEIREGYIAMNGGHRAGVCGRSVDGGNVRDLSSVNIRIAREVPGAADALIKQYTGGGVLIAGPPGCGKTTVLRDLIRQLSDGIGTKPHRLCAVDTRGELSASFGGVCGNDLGRNTDVLLGYDKPKGIEIALRTLFPDLVAFDEIGTLAELNGVEESLQCGVGVLCTAHIGSQEELTKRPLTNRLLKSGAIQLVVLLRKDYSMQMLPREALAV